MLRERFLFAVKSEKITYVPLLSKLPHSITAMYWQLEFYRFIQRGWSKVKINSGIKWYVDGWNNSIRSRKYYRWIWVCFSRETIVKASGAQQRISWVILSDFTKFPTYCSDLQWQHQTWKNRLLVEYQKETMPLKNR